MQRVVSTVTLSLAGMSIIQSVPNICFSNGSGDGDGDKLWCFVLLNEDVLLGGQTIAVPGRQNSDALAEERDFVIASQPKKNWFTTYQALQAALHYNRDFRAWPVSGLGLPSAMLTGCRCPTWYSLPAWLPSHRDAWGILVPSLFLLGTLPAWLCELYLPDRVIWSRPWERR